MELGTDLNIYSKGMQTYIAIQFTVDLAKGKTIKHIKVTKGTIQGYMREV